MSKDQAGVLEIKEVTKKFIDAINELKIPFSSIENQIDKLKTFLTVSNDVEESLLYISEFRKEFRKNNALEGKFLYLVDNFLVDLWILSADFSEYIFAEDSHIFKQKIERIEIHFYFLLTEEKENRSKLQRSYKKLEAYWLKSINISRKQFGRYLNGSLKTKDYNEIDYYLKNIDIFKDSVYDLYRKFFETNKVIDPQVLYFLVAVEYESFKDTTSLEILMKGDFSVLTFSRYLGVLDKIEQDEKPIFFDLESEDFWRSFDQAFYNMLRLAFAESGLAEIRKIFSNLFVQVESLCKMTQLEFKKISKLSIADPELYYPKNIYLSLAKLRSLSIICECTGILIERLIDYDLELEEIDQLSKFVDQKILIIEQAIGMQKNSAFEIFRNIDVSTLATLFHGFEEKTAKLEIKENKADNGEMTETESEEETLSLLECIETGAWDKDTNLQACATFMSLSQLELKNLCLEIKQAGEKYLAKIRQELKNIPEDKPKLALEALLTTVNEFTKFCQSINEGYQESQLSFVKVDQPSLSALLENCAKIQEELRVCLQKYSPESRSNNRSILMPGLPSSSSGSSSSSSTTSSIIFLK